MKITDFMSSKRRKDCDSLSAGAGISGRTALGTQSRTSERSRSQPQGIKGLTCEPILNRPSKVKSEHLGGPDHDPKFDSDEELSELMRNLNSDFFEVASANPGSEGRPHQEQPLPRAELSMVKEDTHEQLDDTIGQLQKSKGESNQSISKFVAEGQDPGAWASTFDLSKPTNINLPEYQDHALHYLKGDKITPVSAALHFEHSIEQADWYVEHQKAFYE